MTITVTRDVQHNTVPCIHIYTPQHVRAKETYKRDLQKKSTKFKSEQMRPIQETYGRNQHNDKRDLQNYKRDLEL